MIEQDELKNQKIKAEYYDQCNKVIDMLNTIREQDDKDIEIEIICPACKSKKKILISKIKLKPNNLTTISIPSGSICEHTFQAFIDKQFKVRGYQKVDLEISPNFFETDKNTVSQGNNNITYPYIENETSIYEKNNNKKNNRRVELYEKFWEFIDSDNPTFRDLIIKDNRRILKDF